MKLAKKTHYGIKMLTFLAAHPDQWYSLPRLGEELDMPALFLKHIAASLKRHRILDSQGGMHGGYRLSRNPREITLAKIFHVLGEPIRLVPCSTKQCNHQKCVTGPFWETVTKNLTVAFENSTLDTIVRASVLPKNNHS